MFAKAFASIAIFLGVAVSPGVWAEAPRRIIPLTPAIAEMTADILGEDLDAIVGVTEYADEPAALLKKKKVGPYHRIHLEAALALKPDLIIAASQGNSKDQVERLEKLGVKTLVVDSNTVDDIPKSIQKIGQALDRASTATLLEKKFSAQLEEITKRAQTRVKNTKPPRVVFQVGWNPLIVVGGTGFLNESIAKLGAQNVASELIQAFPKVSVEAVLSWKPEKIIVLALGKDETRERESIVAWKKLGVQATLHRNDAIARPSLRLVQGLYHLEKELFPK
ncbi:MAG: ABC transporter substrate-binding protein [Bdellovibrionales bacterium]|nr:ABC transporter substrate-binding protein [Bdellovibrionales bacterium]